MYKRAVIYFKDGEKDWIDPIENNGIVRNNDLIQIYNGYNTYDFNSNEISKIEILTIQTDGDGEIIFEN